MQTRVRVSSIHCDDVLPESKMPLLHQVLKCPRHQPGTNKITHLSDFFYFASLNNLNARSAYHPEWALPPLKQLVQLAVRSGNTPHEYLPRPAVHAQQIHHLQDLSPRPLQDHPFTLRHKQAGQETMVYILLPATISIDD